MINSAFTTSECIHALSLVSVLSIENSSVQAACETFLVWDAVSEMILRVEDGLQLLVPCRDSSRAIASGLRNDISTASEADSTSQADNPNISFRSTVDEYYFLLQSLLLKFAFDQNIISFDFSPPSAYLIKNTSILKVLRFCLKSKRQNLVRIAIQLTFIFLRMGPINAVLLEKGGLIALFENYCINYSVQSCLMKSSSDWLGYFESENVLAQDNNSSAINSDFKYFQFGWEIFCDSVLILKTISICFVHRDENILSVLSLISLWLWFPKFSLHKPTRRFTCSNCEIEMASVECLHER